MVTWCCAYNNCNQRFEKGITFHKFPKDPQLRQQWVIATRRHNWKSSSTSKLCSRHFLPSCYETQGWTTRKKLKPHAVPSIFNFSQHLIEKSYGRPSPKKRSLSPPLYADLEAESVSNPLPTENMHDTIQTTSRKKRKTVQIDTLSLSTSHDELEESSSIPSTIEESNDVIKVTSDYFCISSSSKNNTSALTMTLDKSETPSVSNTSPTEKSNALDTISVKKRKKKRNHFLGDFNENNLSQCSHIELCKFIRVAREKLKRKNQKMRLLRQTVRRQSNKIKSFDQLVENLTNKNLTSLETASTIRVFSET